MSQLLGGVDEGPKLFSHGTNDKRSFGAYIDTCMGYFFSKTMSWHKETKHVKVLFDLVGFGGDYYEGLLRLRPARPGTMTNPC